MREHAPPPPFSFPIFSVVYKSLFSLCCPSAPSDSNTGAVRPIRPTQTAKLHPKTSGIFSDEAGETMPPQNNLDQQIQYKNKMKYEIE